MTVRYDEVMTAEQRDKVVSTLIRSLNSIPKDINQRFKGVMQKGRPIPGFNKDPFRAPPPILKQTILERMEQMPEFAAIVTDVWTYAQTELRDLVSAHIKDLDIPDADSDQVDPDYWQKQADAFAAEHADYAKADILLMMAVCYTAGRHMPSDDEAPPSESDRIAKRLSGTIDWLGVIPAEAPQWDDAIPQFSKSLTDLIAAKQEERRQAATLGADLEDMKTAYAAELAFFSPQARDWSAAKLATSAHISETAGIVATLNPLLAKYQPISRPADSIAEERIRREERHELEDAIEPLTSRINEIMEASQAADSAPEDAPDAAAQPVQDTLADMRARLDDISQFNDDLSARLDDISQTNDDLKTQIVDLTQTNEDLQADNFRLQGEIDGLNSDKQELNDEISELKSSLHISETNATNWRNAYDQILAARYDESAPEPIPLEFESMVQVIELAKERYADNLHIRLNKKSDITDFYRNPKEVWDALDWLATTYYKTQTGAIRVKDLDVSLRQVCSGWSYASDQTDITVNTYPEWYTTSVDGVRYPLRRHIGKGRVRSAKNLIRIAFDWDDETKRVIVGYIGPHQRNRNS